MSTAEKETAIVVHQDTRPAIAQTYEPTSMTEALQLARILVNSRLLPRAVQTPEQAFTIILAGKELGFTAMQSLRGIHVIEGKPALSADAILALIQRSPQCEYFRLVKSDDVSATYETLRRGYPAPIGMAFTIEDAQKAKLTGKDNWNKYPAAMLRARCITALGRAVYADLAMGVYELDELPQPAERDVTPKPVRGVVTDTGVSVDGETTEKPIRGLEEGAIEAMLARLEEGFANWEAKRAWAAENKATKLSLSPEGQARVTAAFKRATPTTKGKQVEPPPDPEQTAPSGDDVVEDLARADAQKAAGRIPGEEG